MQRTLGSDAVALEFTVDHSDRNCGEDEIDCAYNQQRPPYTHSNCHQHHGCAREQQETGECKKHGNQQPGQGGFPGFRFLFHLRQQNLVAGLQELDHVILKFGHHCCQ